MVESFAYLPIVGTPRVTLWPLRRYFLPPTDIAEWLHHGYLCRWVGADIPLQRIILPGVSLPPMPERFVYRVGGTGYTYTRQEMTDALRIPPTVTHSAYRLSAERGLEYGEFRQNVLHTLSAMSFRKETVGMIFRTLPIGGKIRSYQYPSLQPASLEGFLSNVWDALPDNVFIWRWRKISYRGDNPCIFLHTPTTMAWWGGDDRQRGVIRRALMQFRLTARVVDIKRHCRRIEGPLWEAVMPQEALDAWARGGIEGVGGDHGPSRTHPFRQAVASWNEGR